MESPSGDFSHWRSPGVFTKTVIQSPVVRWLLHARIRSPDFCDILQIGFDFIHVKQIDRRGELIHVTSKNDFSAPIRAARIFDVDRKELSFDEAIKQESNGEGRTGQAALPPQLLLLTLGHPVNDLVFLYMVTDKSGISTFQQESLPLLKFDRLMSQPGEYLTVDPRSRAIAVAALDTQILLYSTKDQAQLKNEVEAGVWSPITAQRAVQVDGAVQSLEFLIPPEDDPEHIILLVIVVEARRTKAIRIDWYQSEALSDIHIHTAQPLDFDRTSSSMLIPLRNAAFLMTAGGNDIHYFQGILSGSVRSSVFPALEDMDPAFQGVSPRDPLWTSWCRPSQALVRDAECLFLAREDGMVCYLEVAGTGSRISTTFVGDLGCHVSTAFVSFDSPEFPDLLVAAGDMSSGRVVSIDLFSGDTSRMPNSSLETDMGMSLVQRLPNWASATDLVVLGLTYWPSRSPRPRTGVYITSNRQPYGSITELRQGLEAQVVVMMEDDESSTLLRSVTDLWPLPVADGTLLLVMSGPSSTVLFSFTGLLDDASQLDGDDAAIMDLEHRTLVAAVTRDGCLIQITERCICITTWPKTDFEHNRRSSRSDHESILAAAIEPHQAVVVTTERHGPDLLLCSYHVPQLITHSLEPTTMIPLKDPPLAIAVTRHRSDVLAAIVTANSLLRLFTLDDQGVMQSLYDIALPELFGDYNACESIGFIHSSSSRLLILCGLREGSVVPIFIDFPAGDDRNIKTGTSFRIGQSTVRINQLKDDGSSVCATSGPDTCRISWNGNEELSLSIDPIIFADKARPSLMQGNVTAFSLIPGWPFINALNDKLRRQVEMEDMIVAVLDGGLVIARLDRSLSSVPCQMLLHGTPNRLIYDARHKCFVCASQRTRPVSSRTSSSTRYSRQIYPSIEFISNRGKVELPYVYDMGPGEQVYALASWSYISTGESDKAYSFILVGGSYPSSRDPKRQKGRISFLQPRLDNRQVVGVKVSINLIFDDPVYAISAYNDTTFIICYGMSVSIYRFSYVDRKWASICRPLILSNRAASVTVNAPLIHIATAGDSLVSLSLDESFDPPRLIHHAHAPEAAVSLSHLIISPHASEEAATEPSVALLSTMYCELIGLSVPPPRLDDASRRALSHSTLFTATLPVSLTRLRRGDLRPLWRAPSPSGVLVDDIIGSATNGAILGVALLDAHLTRRLSWLQRLCEWSPALSPLTHRHPAYNAQVTAVTERFERIIPAGLAAGSRGEILTRTNRRKEELAYIDGDVLARLLAGDKRQHVAGLKQFMRDLAQQHERTGGEEIEEARNDRAGVWLAEHLDEELKAVDEVVGIVERLMDRWI